ncbi:GlxA family transcriptional regulator, partial [Bradyrhizobium brasilense]|uniref:DJ-1/PfpI family protein n=1 Tax=Bradyrhizobium brasilense TaxID=1419277 RepID=UPI0016BAC71C
CPQLDVICVPGGFGTDDMVGDEEMLAFLRKQAEGAKYVTSVCSGAYVLAEAGLLDGRRATTHWQRTPHFVKTYPKIKLEPDQ